MSKKFPKLNYRVKNKNHNYYKFIEKIDENLFLWKKGIWTISKPIILEKDLIIKEGTEINLRINPIFI